MFYCSVKNLRIFYCLVKSLRFVIARSKIQDFFIAPSKVRDFYCSVKNLRFFIAWSKVRDLLLLGQKSEIFYCSVKSPRFVIARSKIWDFLLLGQKFEHQIGIQEERPGRCWLLFSETASSWSNTNRQVWNLSKLSQFWIKIQIFCIAGKKSKIFYWSGCSFLIKAGLGQTSTVKFGTSDFHSLSSVLEGVSGLDCEYISPAKILNGSPV